MHELLWGEACFSSIAYAWELSRPLTPGEGWHCPMRALGGSRWMLCLVRGEIWRSHLRVVG